jgi:hypothetical protein
LRPDLALLRGNRQTSPSAVVTRGVLDTGSNITGVSASVI